MGKRVVISVISFAAIFALLLFLTNDANRYAIMSDRGYINEGRRFGVAVGSRVEDARKTLLEQGFTEVIGPSDLGAADFGALDEYIFLDRGWRRGVVSVKISDNHVTGIGWHYQLGAP